MKTKIIYISGSEIFNIADIRSAFEEVRNALQLESDTVLFGVPVDKEDAGFGNISNTEIPTDKSDSTNDDIVNEQIETIATVEETPLKTKKTRRTRVHKDITLENIDTDNIPETVQDSDDQTEKIVPILSVLSTDSPEKTPESDSIIDDETQEQTETVEIITDITEEQNADIITEIDESPEIENKGEPDLEQLLSEMTPLQEDLEHIPENTQIPESTDTTDNDVDATLEQLATEFAEAQDKIISETKSSGRSKISKLRNILPFKQSKHKDQGLGDLFGWAGVAANDEDFSVPGFFTNATSKK